MIERIKKKCMRKELPTCTNSALVVRSKQSKNFYLTYGLGEKEARRPTPKWNTRFYLTFSIKA